MPIRIATPERLTSASICSNRLSAAPNFGGLSGGATVGVVAIGAGVGVGGPPVSPCASSTRVGVGCGVYALVGTAITGVVPVGRLVGVVRGSPIAVLEGSDVAVGV
jgi:hypothetical protein